MPEIDGRAIATGGVDIIKQVKANQGIRPLFTPDSITLGAFNETRHVLSYSKLSKGFLGHSTIFTYCESLSCNPPWLAFSREKGSYLMSSF